MKKLIIFLGLIAAIGANAQTHEVIVSKKFNVKVAQDVVLKPGTTGTLDLSDSSKVYMFIPEPGVTKLIYTVPNGTTPVPVPDSVQVDNLATTILYTGAGWTHASNNPCCGWYQNSLSYNSTVGSSLTYAWVGNKIVYYAEKAANKGKVSVQVDNGPVTTVTLTGNGGVDNVTKKPSYVWKGTPGAHTIKIVALGGGDIALDKLVYHFNR